MNTSEEDENKMSENTKESELKGKRSLTLYQPLAISHATRTCRDYLLCRDLYISTIIIIICYVISCSILSVFYWNIESVVYLICMLLVTNISAHIKGRRFAINVVAYDLHTDNTK